MRLAIDAITQAEGSRTAAPPAQALSPLLRGTPRNPQQRPQPLLAATVIPATTQPQSVTAPAPTTPTPVEDQKHDGQDGSAAPAAEKNRNTAKAEAKLNDTTAKPDKWVVNASMAAIAPPAIPFIEARKQKIEELNATHGLGPGHNRAKARTQPNAIPELVKRFKEEVLGQPFKAKKRGLSGWKNEVYPGSCRSK